MKYTHLTYKDRAVIEKLLNKSTSILIIAKMIDKHFSTIYREVNRNSTNPYCARTAHKLYLQRRRSSIQLKRYNKKLVLECLWMMTQYFSPEQTSNRLRILYPNDQTMRVSHETIYKWIYHFAAKGLDIIQYMRRMGSINRVNRKRKAKIELKKGFKSIHERPIEASKRKKTGHWETDLMEGKKGTGYVLVAVDKKSTLLMAKKISNKKQKTFVSTIVEMFKNNIPQKTMTHDRGFESYDFESIESLTNLNVYYADPGNPGQRGLCENTIGLLRQFIPKGTDMREITQQMLDKFVDLINKRPRESLGYFTPEEVFTGLEPFALHA